MKWIWCCFSLSLSRSFSAPFCGQAISATDRGESEPRWNVHTQKKTRAEREREKCRRKLCTKYFQLYKCMYKIKWRERKKNMMVLSMAKRSARRYSAAEGIGFSSQCQWSERVVATAAWASAHRKQKERSEKKKKNIRPRNENNPMETRYRDMYITAKMAIRAKAARERRKNKRKEAETSTTIARQRQTA